MNARGYKQKKHFYDPQKHILYELLLSILLYVTYTSHKYTCARQTINSTDPFSIHFADELYKCVRGYLFL